MPKVRSGNKYKVLYDQNTGLKKSGVLTNNFKNLFLKKDNEQGSIPVNNTFSKSGEINYNQSFNDNNTVFFNQKTIDLITKTDDSVSKENILNTPNEFTFSDYNLTNQNTNSVFYDRLLNKNIFEESYTPFDENTTFYENKNSNSFREVEIEIPLNFNQENGGVCQLSLNKNFAYIDENNILTPGSIPKIQYPKTPIYESWWRYSSPMAYFNFEDNRWDYLGDISEYSYIEDPDNLDYHYNKGNVFAYDDSLGTDKLGNPISSDFYLESWINKTHLGFSGLTNDPKTSTFYNPGEDIYNESILGGPIGNFGFPAEGKFFGRENNLIDLSKYITKDFYLKKFVVQGVFSNRSVGSPARSGNDDLDTTGPNLAINFVNFFLLNQRKNFDENSVDEIYGNSDYRFIGVYDQSSNNNDAAYSIFNDPNLSNMSSVKRSYFQDNIIDSSPSIVNVSSLENKPTQREIITFNTLVNFCDTGLAKIQDQNFNLNENYYVADKERLQESADYFNDISLDDYFKNPSFRGNSLAWPVGHYDRKKITIESNVKASIKQERSHPYSRYRFFPSNVNGNRTQLKSITSGRSNKQEFNTLKIKENKEINVKVKISNTDVEFPYSYPVYEIQKKEDFYCLKPEDDLILGVNLSTAFFNPEMDVTHLYGSNGDLSNGNYYVEYIYGDDTFVIHDLKIKLIGTYFENENHINISNNKSLTSKNIRRSIIGDKTTSDVLYSTPSQLLNGSYFERVYEDHGISSGLSSNSNAKSITNTVALNIDNEILLDTSLPNIIDLLAVNNITPDVNGEITIDKNGGTNSGSIFSFWNSEGPFLAKYNSIDRPELIDYTKLLNKIKISDDLRDEIYDVANPPASYNDIDSDLFYGEQLTNDLLLKYFYSFNSNNTSRFPIYNRDFDVTTSGTQSKDRLTSIEGFKTGVLNYYRSNNKIRFSTLGFGQYSNIINKFSNYVTVENNIVSYTIEKVFYNENFEEVNTAETNTLNTYNKDYYARITKPFIDKSIEDLEANSDLGIA